ncbi:MAG TPA: response regulator [Candidatus Saccharimonadales bacterium]|jgi:DNA-binding response OmpR family regulator
MSQVLLVEPDRPLAKTYQAALRQAGHKVKVAASSQEAINVADKTVPDVVVLEIQLIRHSGIEFLYEFRSYPEWQGIPVLIHTNVPYQELKDGWPLLSEHLGVAKYKYKPDTNLEALISSVNELTQ